MKPLLLLACLAGVSCGPGASDNPPRFWISLDGTELKLRLAPVEPVPF